MRYALRSLLKAPAFTAVAVATLALGIGATSTVFSVVNGVLLKPLPYPESERLVLLLENNQKKGWDQFALSPPNFVDFRAQNRSFEGLSAWSTTSYNLTGTGEPERLPGAQVSEGFFDVLKLTPALGRSFAPNEFSPGNHRVAVLGYGLWQRRFAGARDVLGKPITLNGESYTVVGVMPQGIAFPDRETTLWTPLVLDAQAMSSRGAHWLVGVARLKPDVTLDRASAEMKEIAARLEKQYPGSNTGWGAAAWSLLELSVGDVRPALVVLFGVVGLVLLIACANVASLMLARGAARRREVAIRSAIGASASQIVWQLLAESLMLGLMGGALGLVIAVWGVDLLHTVRPDGLPRVDSIEIDGRVMAFTMLVSVVTGLAFGLLPALQLARPNLTGTLREEGGRGATLGRAGQRVRGALVVGEVALSLVLLVGAGLMAKSFLRLRDVSPGFAPDRLLTAAIELPDAKYDSGYKRTDFARQAMERIGGLAGVRATAVVSPLPMGGDDRILAFVIEGRPPLAAGETPSAMHAYVSASYFGAMRIPLVKGREFNDQDRRGAPRVVLVSETFAKKFFPGADPIGQQLRIGNTEGVPRAIVGVVGDVKHYSLRDESQAAMYEPYAQASPSNFTLVVRASGRPEELTAAVRREVRAIDADLPLTKMRTMDQVLAGSVAAQRFNAALLAGFAGLALLLAAIGLYGVVSYTVAQQTHEFGIRMALGAERRHVMRQVMGRAMQLAGAGVAAGLVGALLLTRLLTKMLYGVSATDPTTFVGLALVLTSIALLASWMPARRATRVDPVVALRND
ncbi:MAG TPA: ABC transporter permease [Gemmatimonadaceae bacterium]|nr:ABC transporter permease [Gemmatimonadaceae bacterium]